MSQYIEQHRHVCALGGLHSVLAIKRALPILHSGPGCGQRVCTSVGINNGFQGAGYIGGKTLPCTNIGENEIVFGGEEKLRQTVHNALKIIDADLFVILTSCAPEIIGDDIAEVTRSFQQQGKRVIFAETGGFNGSNYIGHEIVVNAVIDQYLKPTDEKIKGLVNIWSVVPYQDPFWVGNYREIEKLILEIGLTPNIIFGPDGGIEAVERVPKAEFNLIVSPWVGLNNGRLLEEKFNTPYLHYPVFPIGPTETSKFLHAVGSFAGIDPVKVDRVIAKHEAKYYYFFERALEVFYEIKHMSRRFITVADSFYSLGIAKFLVNDLGLIPETQYITDDVPSEYQEKIEKEFSNFDGGITADVHFSNDGGWIHEEIKKNRLRGKPILLGSTWERILAEEINAFHLSVAMPVSDRLVLNGFYAGYDGALKLIEDIYSAIISDPLTYKKASL